MKATRASTGNLPAHQDPLRFLFEGLEVRAVDREGNPWFIGLDVCRVLSLGNHKQALSRLPESERATIKIPDALGRERDTTIISLAGVFRLVLTSRVEGAEKFKTFLTGELLPTWYRTGNLPTGQPGPDVSALASEVAALREQLTAPQRPALPPPPKPDVAAARKWGAAVDESETALKEADKALNRLRLALGTLTKLPRPSICPAPVPRSPEPKTLPHDGRYYWARLTHCTSLPRDTLALPIGERTLAVSSATWWAWLGGDIEAGREVGRACDHFGLAHDAVAETIAHLVR